MGGDELVEEMLLACSEDDLDATASAQCLKRPMYKKSPAHLVVDICNIHDEFHIELKVVAHDTPNDICADIVPGMTQMRIIVDSRPASIPGHLLSFRVNRNEWSFRPRQRIPDLQRW